MSSTGIEFLPMKHLHRLAALCVIVMLAAVANATASAEYTLALPEDHAAIRAAIDAKLRMVGSEITDRKRSNDEHVRLFESADARLYRPTTWLHLKLGGRNEPRYWLTRETYDTEQAAEQRVSEYLSPDYTKRITSALGEKATWLGDNTTYVSKTVQRISAKRHKTIVYLLTTDVYADYLNDRKRQNAILISVVGL